MKTSEKSLLILLVILIVAAGVAGVYLAPVTPRAATTYYVALTGSNSNAGSASAPWRNLMYAVGRLAAGDHLCIGPGTWTADVIDSQAGAVPSGTDLGSGAITIGACHGDVAILKPPDNTAAIRLSVGAPHHLVFQDLTVDMSLNTVLSPKGGPPGVYVASGTHHVRFQRMTVHSNVGSCFEIGNFNGESPFNEILHSVMHTCGTGRDTADNDGYAVYSFTNDTTIDGNEIRNIGGYGITAYGDRVRIFNNRIHDTGVNGGFNYGIVIGSSAHPTPSRDGLIINNTLYRNQGGILLYTSSANVGVYQNTITGNPLHEGIGMQYYGAGSVIENNIVWNNNGGIVDHGGTGTSRIDHNVEADPHFVDATKNDYRLASSTSPAFNTGLALEPVHRDADGVARPQADHYDVGAYELPVSDPLPPPPTSVTPVLVPALSESGALVSATPVILQALICANPTERRVYIQLFDGPVAAVGTGLPVWSPSIPPNSTLPLVGLSVPFTEALALAATTTPTGRVGPSAPVSCNLSVSTRLTDGTRRPN